MVWKNVWDSFSSVFGTDVEGFTCNVAGEENVSQIEMLGIYDDVVSIVVKEFDKAVGMHFPDISITNSTILGRYSIFQMDEFDSSDDATFEDAILEIIGGVEVGSIVIEKIEEYKNI